MSDSHDGGGGLRWLLTYADMITLLMAFFIMMYSMSAISMEKFEQAAAGLRAEFGGAAAEAEAGGGGVLSHRMEGNLPELEDDLQTVKEQLEEYIRENELENLIRTGHEARGLVITLVSDNLLFPVGDATLRAPALTILDKIAGLLQHIPNLIVIEGHTCDLPISTDRYPSNWELSAARACAVVRYLAGQWNIEPVRMAATGYGESRPIHANDDETGRALNRRVGIVILASSPVAEAEASAVPGEPEAVEETEETPAAGVGR